MTRTLLLLLLSLFLVPSLFAAPTPTPAQVKTEPLQRRQAPVTQSLTGSLYFDRISDLSFEVSGAITEILFQEGDRVSKGQVLARLNTDFIDQQIAETTAKLQQAEVSLQHARRDFERYQQLYEQQAASATAYDQLFFRVKELEHEIAATRAQLQTARLKQDKSTLRTPFDGLVLSKDAERGNWITTGSRIARIAAADAIYIRVPVSEDQARFSHSGQQLPVHLTATDETLSGSHAGFLPVVDARTRNVFIRIHIPQPQQLFENMSATVELPTAAQQQQLMVPRDALVKFNGQDFIYSIKDDKAAIVPVQVTGFSSDQAAISGPSLQEGMPVVIEGNERLRPEQPVIILNQPAKAVN
ncbi:MAG: efflux RND transporter periplasmic adaptor subunit [Desulfuromonadaceae bacterium]|nr:efflux RND transporter periplasmic adaptor subunit [Desulfuromonadaceae bacterium]